MDKKLVEVCIWED